MKANYLISARELADEARNADIRVVDCRYTLSEPEAGRRSYLDGHIPGAVYADLDRDLAAPVGPGTGRHPLPDPDRFADRLGGWGIDPGTRVVAYDEGSGAIAARLWWLLGWLGHAERLVLDGGYRAWLRAGLSVEKAEPDWPRRRYAARPDWRRVVDTATVAAEFLSRPGLVDARAARRFAGAEEPIDPVAGHIPGAVNLPYERNLDAEGRFLPAEVLREQYRRLAPDPPGGPVMMCGSGVTACHNALAMAVAGLPEPRVYVGSWSAWISDRTRPIAVQAADE